MLGSTKVSRLVLGLVSKWVTAEASVEFTLVNGEPGLVWYSRPGVIGGVMAFAVADGRITEAYAVVNPEKLTHLNATPEA
ncbi:hypothetical protein GCM10009639_38700 [Kitasatospora putterlickiae]|uniref:RNA polymerase ECF-subfamily sigma factor n=1 Tax=Kitasatospora putterlickiae TaxID=221725 RepID=A0ABN1Y8Q1_9ACTN